MTKDDVWKLLSEPQFLITSSQNHTRRTLAHYADVQTLEGILMGRQLWFSQATYMNDISEVREGVRLLQQLDGGRLSPLMPARELIYSVSKIAWNSCLEKFSRDFDNIASNVFLSCWSGRDPYLDDLDDLVMWRAYGGDGDGVAIVIDPSLIRIEENDTAPITATPVYYETFEQFSSRATTVFNAFALAVEKLGASRADEFNNVIGETFSNLCMALVCTHKHPGFSSEREWRFVWVRSSFDESFPNSCVVQNEGGSQTMRLPLMNSYGLVPSTGTMEPDKLITAVIIGPSAMQDQRLSHVEQLREKAGASFKIYKSSIPYRSSMRPDNR